MIRLRKITQIVSLLVFVAFLIAAAQPIELLTKTVDIYPRMSPLLFAATWLNTFVFPIAFIPAIVVLGMTLVLGRFFCGWVCPLGVTIDATDKWIGPRKRNDAAEYLKWKPVKYVLLIVIIIASYFEANLAGWLDPLSLATRLYSLALLPAAEFMGNLLLSGLKPIPGGGFVAGNAQSFLRTAISATDGAHFHGMVAIFLIYLGIALLVFFNRRFWCRFLCPAGAIFALTSRFSIWRRVVDYNKCIKCGKCERTCRMGAITAKGTEGFKGECIECFTCKKVCPVGAVSFRPFTAGADKQPVSMSRRMFMASLGGAAVAIPLTRIAPGRPGANIVRPPGVPSEDAFMQTCLRCGECMRVCPTNGLQPVWGEAGLEGLWTPKLAARVGNCEFMCNRCGQVCPSNAILALDQATKQNTVMGRAVFDHNRCIPWSRGENCAVCEEQCPVAHKAIRLREADYINDNDELVKVYKPYVVESICIGCGTCEKVCPVEGAAGVRVTGVPQFIVDAGAAPAVKSGQQYKFSGAVAAPAMPQLDEGWAKTASLPATSTAAITAATGTLAAAASASGTLDVVKVTPPPIPDGRLPIQLKPLLPRDIPGWKPDGDVKFAIPSTLYDLIDGGAEVYLEYGFVKCMRQDYSKGNDYLTVDVHFMKDVSAAFGIFSNERGPGDASVGIGRNSAVNDTELKFWQDSYFVKISGDAGRQEFVSIAKSISAEIGAAGGAVPAVSLRAKGFPTSVAESQQLLRGPLSMRRLFSFGTKDIFGFASGTIGISYMPNKGSSVTAAAIKLGNKTTAAQVVKDMESALKDKGFNASKPGGDIPAGYTVFENGGRKVGYDASGDLISIAVVSGDE